MQTATPSDGAFSGDALAATAVILAGGKSRRMGFDKASADFGGTPLGIHVATIVAPWFSQVLVSSVRTTPFDGSGFTVVQDREAGLGALGGLSSALAAASFPWVFALACDMPLLRRPLVQLLWSLRHGFDAVVPSNHGKPEPLCAFYSAACAGAIGSLAARGAGVYEIAGEVRTRAVGEEEWLPSDPERLSFTNVNTPQELAKALEIARLMRRSLPGTPAPD